MSTATRFTPPTTRFVAPAAVAAEAPAPDGTSLLAELDVLVAAGRHLTAIERLAQVTERCPGRLIAIDRLLREQDPRAGGLFSRAHQSAAEHYLELRRARRRVDHPWEARAVDDFFRSLWRVSPEHANAYFWARLFGQAGWERAFRNYLIHVLPALCGEAMQEAGARVLAVLDEDPWLDLGYRRHVLAVAAGRVRPGEFMTASLRRTGC